MARYSRILLIVLLGASLGVRVLWLGYPGRVPILDEAYYLSAAHNILGLEQLPGNPYPYARPGLDPLIEHPIAGKLLIALSMRLLGDTPYAWRLPSAIAGTIVIWLVYLLAHRVTRRRGVALAAATLTALDPMMLVNSRIAMLEIFVAALILATLHFYVRRRPVLAGVAAALAVCVKLTGLSAILSVVAFEALRTLRHRIRARRWHVARLRSLTIALAVCAAGVPLLLWVFNSRASLFPNPFDNLRYMYTHLAATFSFRPPDAIVVPQSRPWEWLLNVREIGYLSQGVMQLRGLYNPLLVFAFAPVMAWAAWDGARRGASAALLVLAIVAGCYLPLVAGSLTVPRPAYLYYFLPVVPALAIGLAALGARAKVPRALKAGYLVAAAIAFLYLLSIPRVAVSRCLVAVVVAALGLACVNGPRWEATVARAREQRDRGDYAAAERSLLDALAQADRLHPLHPYELETNTELARLYFKAGEFDKAKAALTRLIAKLETLYRQDHPSIGAMHGDLGRACDALGQLDEARAHYDKALTVALQAPAQNAIDYLYLDMAINAQRRGLTGEADVLFAKAEAAARVLQPGGPIFDEIRNRRK